MMQKFLFLFLLVSTCFIKVYGQTEKHATDTIFLVDTIGRKDTVEKVVYIYGPPEKHISLSALTLFSLPNISISGHEIDAQKYGISFQIEKINNYLILDAGLNFGIYDINVSSPYSFIQEKTIAYTILDTLDMYMSTNPTTGEMEWVPTTEEIEMDSIQENTIDTVYTQRNTFNYISTPLLVGLQLKYGFFNIDLKTGLTPSLLLSYPTDLIHSNLTGKKIEYINKFTLDATAGASFRYLFSIRSQVSAECFFTIPLIHKHSSSHINPLFTNSFHFNIGYSYILTDK